MVALGEFGGVPFRATGHLWKPSEKGWGYGVAAELEQAKERYSELMDGIAVLARSGLAGSVYTQTTDVELFVNGTKVLSMGGYNSNYQNMPINRKAFEKAVREGENEFSAHVRQTQAGQYFDCALMIDQAL
jgi:hypothetical protein